MQHADTDLMKFFISLFGFMFISFINQTVLGIPLLPFVGATLIYLFLDLRQSKSELNNKIQQLSEDVVHLELALKKPGKGDVAPRKEVESSEIAKKPKMEEKVTPAPISTPEFEVKAKPKPSIPIKENPPEIKPSPEPVRQSPPPIESFPDKSTSQIYVMGQMVSRFFTTGNVFAKVGAIILFFGVAFLIKLVSDSGLFPIEFRLISSAIGANILIGIGFKLRRRSEAYGLILQGTGFGIFYLTVFGAFRLWGLLPAIPAMIMLVVATVLFVMLSLFQEALPLAVLAVSGGFLAPVLISTGSGSHVALFTYYALLNLGIFAIAKYRPWRELNLVGFLFTYVIGGLWGSKYYVPEYFSTVEPFIILHFILYTAIVLFFSRLTFQLSKEMIVDGILVFGVPLCTFFYQAALLKDTRFGIAITCAILGVIYVGLAVVLFRKKAKERLALTQSFVGSGIVFSTLAVPYAISNIWTGSVWAIEGAALVWFGLKHEKKKIRSVGYALNVIGLLYFFSKEIVIDSLSRIINPPFIGSMILCLSTLVTAYFLFKKVEKLSEDERILSLFFVGIAFFWWFSAASREMFVWYPTGAVQFVMGLGVWLVSLSALLFYALARALAWSTLSLIRYPFIVLSAWYWFRGIDKTFAADHIFFLNPLYLGSVVAVLAASFISYSLFTNRQIIFESEKKLAFFFIGFAYLIVFSSTYFEWIGLYKKSNPEDVFSYAAGANLFVVISSLIVMSYHVVSVATQCRELAVISYGLPVYGAITLFRQLTEQQNPFEHYGFASWAMLLGVLYTVYFERKEKSFNRYIHYGGLWLLSFVVLWYVFRIMGMTVTESSVWKWAGMLAAGGALVLGVIYYPEGLYPFGHNKKAYITEGITPCVFVLVLTAQVLNLVNSGYSAPLPFIPVLNPLEILVIFTFVVSMIWFKKARFFEPSFSRATPLVTSIFGGFFFLWVTMVVVRSVHHYFGVPWGFESLFAARSVQTALSVCWGGLSLLIMVFSNRKGSRTMWILGTCLIVIVVGKLFFIDLSGKGTLERVISFIVTGILLLATGYFAPIPPREGRS